MQEKKKHTQSTQANRDPYSTLLIYPCRKFKNITQKKILQKLVITTTLDLKCPHEKLEKGKLLILAQINNFFET